MAFPHEAILVFNFFTALVDAFPNGAINKPLAWKKLVIALVENDFISL